MPITSVCTFTILCGGMRTARWEVIHYQCPALPFHPSRISTRSPINRHSPRGRRGKSSLGARSDMHPQLVLPAWCTGAMVVRRFVWVLGGVRDPIDERGNMQNATFFTVIMLAGHKWPWRKLGRVIFLAAARVALIFDVGSA